MRGWLCGDGGGAAAVAAAAAEGDWGGAHEDCSRMATRGRRSTTVRHWSSEQETKKKTELNKNEESELRRTSIDFGHGCEEAIQTSCERCGRTIQSVTVCIDTLQ
jgi:hypothetical protein